MKKENVFKRTGQDVELFISFVAFISVFSFVVFSEILNFNYNTNIVIGIMVALIVNLIATLVMPSSFKYLVYVDEDYIYIEEPNKKGVRTAFEIPSLKVEQKGRIIWLNDEKQKQRYYWNAQFLIFLVSIAKNRDTVETEEEHVS